MARSAPKTSAATPKAAKSAPAQISRSTSICRAGIRTLPRRDYWASREETTSEPLRRRFQLLTRVIPDARSAIRDPQRRGDGAWIPALRFAPAGMTGGGDEEDDRRDRRRHGRRRGGELPAARGHDVVLVEPGNPGEGTSFGNAGCLNGSSVVPMSMPGTIRNVPRWLTDPMGPLVIRWSYLPTLAPWLIR